ncbi:hypothetical protein M9X92_012034 [Pyricularia oryzae]|nr:hypothetical protein M9X92_012034 [Pyricularia oryzae]
MITNAWFPNYGVRFTRLWRVAHEPPPGSWQARPPRQQTFLQSSGVSKGTGTVFSCVPKLMPVEENKTCKLG